MAKIFEIFDYPIDHSNRSYHLWQRHQSGEERARESVMRTIRDVFERNYARCVRESMEKALEECQQFEQILSSSITGKEGERKLSFSTSCFHFTYDETDSTLFISISEDIAKDLDLNAFENRTLQKFKRPGCPSPGSIMRRLSWQDNEVVSHREIIHYKLSEGYEEDFALYCSIAERIEDFCTRNKLEDHHGGLVGPPRPSFRIGVEKEEVCLALACYHDASFCLKTKVPRQKWEEGVQLILQLYCHQLCNYLQNSVDSKGAAFSEFQDMLKGTIPYATSGDELNISDRLSRNTYLNFIIARAKGYKFHKIQNFYWGSGSHFFGEKKRSFEQVEADAISLLGPNCVSVSAERQFHHKTKCRVLTMLFDNFTACYYEEKKMLLCAANDYTRTTLRMERPVFWGSTTSKLTQPELSKLKEQDDHMSRLLREEERVSLILRSGVVHPQYMKVVKRILDDVTPLIGALGPDGKALKRYTLYLDITQNCTLDASLVPHENYHRPAEHRREDIVALKINEDYESEWKRFFAMWKMQETKYLKSLQQDSQVTNEVRSMSDTAPDPQPYFFKY